MSIEPPSFPSMSPPIADPPAVVMQDVACRKCGYNLRGLSTAGRCPECGTPVGLSVMGDLLRFSNPSWILTLRRGITLILAGIVVLIFGMVGIAIMAAMRMRSSVEFQPVVYLAGYALMLFGGWLLTEPDPSGVGEDQYGTSRRIIRISLVVSAAHSLISWIPQLTTVPPMVQASLAILAALAGLMGLVGQFAQLNYLSKLARRIPDIKLAGRAHFLMWAIGISYGILVVFGAIIAIATMTAGASGPNPILMAGGCMMAIDGLAILVFGLMYLDLLEKLRKRFREQAEVATGIWQAGNSMVATQPVA